jgi:ArsR family transcriptional regulator, arsenate/arsenite/antimonite-responsive transcriptional repressor
MNVDIMETMDSESVIFAQAIADETRQEIMRRLCCNWLSVNDIVDTLGGRVKQPTVSHHLKLLEAANLVHVRQEGRQRFYTLNQQRVTECCGRLVQSFAPNYSVNVIAPDDIPGG